MKLWMATEARAALGNILSRNRVFDQLLRVRDAETQESVDFM